MALRRADHSVTHATNGKLDSYWLGTSVWFGHFRDEPSRNGVAEILHRLGCRGVKVPVLALNGQRQNGRAGTRVGFERR